MNSATEYWHAEEVIGQNRKSFDIPYESLERNAIKYLDNQHKGRK